MDMNVIEKMMREGASMEDIMKIASETKAKMEEEAREDAKLAEEEKADRLDACRMNLANALVEYTEALEEVEFTEEEFYEYYDYAEKELLHGEQVCTQLANLVKKLKTEGEKVFTFSADIKDKNLLNKLFIS